jgi:hypothetical protein
MSESIIERIMFIVLEYLGDEEVRIRVFGSRAKGRQRKGSDIDIAVIPKNDWNDIKLTLLRERLENSNIPWKVDLVDFSKVDEDFKRFASKDMIFWKK